MNVTQVTPLSFGLESTLFCLVIIEVYGNFFMSYIILTTQHLFSINILKFRVWFQNLSQIEITFITL